MEDMDFAAIAKVPDQVAGTAVGMEYNLADELIGFTLNTRFLVKATSEQLAKLPIRISEQVIENAMKEVFNEAHDPVFKAAYEAAIAAEKTPEEATAAGNQAVADAGIELQEHTDAWAGAKTQIANGATAEELVTLLKTQGPAGQKWGIRICQDAYDTQNS